MENVRLWRKNQIAFASEKKLLIENPFNCIDPPTAPLQEGNELREQQELIEKEFLEHEFMLDQHRRSIS